MSNMENNEFTKAQQEHVNIMNTVHIRLYDMLHKYTNKEDIKLDLISLLEYVYLDMQTVRKDINIEATTVERTSF